jgi:hypothetical protein
MTAPLLLLLPALALFATSVNAEPVDTPRHRPNTSHQQGVTDFTAAVNRYAELHRLLEIPLAAPALAADPERKARARKQLRAAIREARAAVLPGDVFTPEVSEYFRHRIELAARDADGAIPVILEALPELPDEVEYRFFGRDLVLLDVEAGLVVDVLKQALPLDEGEMELEELELCAPEDPPLIEQDPCLAHPGLDMCWS